MQNLLFEELAFFSRGMVFPFDFVTLRLRKTMIKSAHIRLPMGKFDQMEFYIKKTFVSAAINMTISNYNNRLWNDHIIVK